MKNKSLQLKDLIRIWMKACFKRAMEKSQLQIESDKFKDKKSQLNNRQKRGINK